MTDLIHFIKQCQNRVERALDARLPHAKHQPSRLHEAMRYSALGNGKRIRPILLYATAKALGKDITPILDAPACAVELIHAYSLVHDDLPAMDDDDLRRGRPTCHKAYDEATAILVGDSLQTLAFQLLSHDIELTLPDSLKIKMIEQLCFASGSLGMAGGQAMDLAAEGKQLSLPELENLHIHKTGALIRTSVNLAGLALNQEKPLLDKLDHYAKCIGLAFQVQDDILDVEGSTETLGKTQGKDVAQAKATYPALIGLSDSKRMAQRLLDEALESLDHFGDDADLLRKLAHYIVTRDF